MADDLDDLLDEVESKFCKASPVKQKPHAVKKQDNNSARPSSQRPKPAKDDLNAMIDDICSDDGLVLPESNEATQPSTKSNQAGSSLPEKRKCFKLFLGGSQFSKGLCTGLEQRTCDKLRCTSCDFSVVMYDDLQWQTDCDYIFFRNNVPDFQRLQSKLIPRKGCRAYACQCLWRSVEDLSDVAADHKLKWVCGKHS